MLNRCGAQVSQRYCVIKVSLQKYHSYNRTLLCDRTVMELLWTHFTSAM
jgi:hypothetical protein